jgi:sarcosine oxidase subunit beta
MTAGVCVIGGGVVGCAVALELRRGGYDVTVLDKNGDVGHGSTAASCGIVRRFYTQPGMIAMAHEAWHIWDDWSAFLGPIDDDHIAFPRPGMLFIPPRIDEGARATLAEMQRLGIRASLLSAEQIAERFPFIDVASNFPPRPAGDPAFFAATGRRIEGGVFEEDAGYVVFPALAAQNLRMAAARDGVTFVLNHRVTGITRVGTGSPAGASRGAAAGGPRFRLDTAGGTSIEAEIVVNVAGPHSAIINAMAGVTLPLQTRPLRREVHALDNPLSAGGAAGGARGTGGAAGDGGGADGPRLPIVGDLDGGIYFRPESGGRKIIVGSTDPQCDALEFVDDPDQFNTGVTEIYRERQCLRLMKRFPQVRLGPAKGVADLYDVTLRDWYPIVDRTDLPGYYVCIGTSGSSFKTAPVLGLLMARIIAACESGHDTDGTPLQLHLPRIDATVDTRFLARRRGDMRSTGTVLG